MARVRLIPCLDVKDARVVKGVQFGNLRDAGDPVEQARLYDRAGADELCFLDISATIEGRAPLLDIVRRTAAACFIPLTVGGGVRTLEDVTALLRAGADKVGINSAAVARPAFIAEAARAVGSQAVIVAIDAKKTGESRYEIFTHGGTRATGQDAVAFAQQAAELGAGELLVTAIDRDGTGEGFDTDLLRAIGRRVNIPLIASGGAGTLDHLVQAAKIGGADAILAASIFHFGIFSVEEAKDYLAKAGIDVRRKEEIG
ncbi:MAG TPA: imidazole glycerol phosphate synthase subunit HisF [Dongiaceae bacterium]|jgi:cyclase|nr:imidazole glycerol phosphate synthase subunit HisF [Dongiaceae bacterium]